MRKTLAVAAALSTMALMPSPAQASSWPREGYTDIGGGIECKLLSGWREWSCWLNDAEFYVECFESYDYDNSTTTVECHVNYAPQTVHAPLAESDRVRVAEAVGNGGHVNLPGWSSPPPATGPYPASAAPATGSDGTNC